MVNDNPVTENHAIGIITMFHVMQRINPDSNRIGRCGGERDRKTNEIKAKKSYAIPATRTFIRHDALRHRFAFSPQAIKHVRYLRKR